MAITRCSTPPFPFPFPFGRAPGPFSSERSSSSLIILFLVGPRRRAGIELEEGVSASGGPPCLSISTAATRGVRTTVSGMSSPARDRPARRRARQYRSSTRRPVSKVGTPLRSYDQARRGALGYPPVGAGEGPLYLFLGRACRPLLVASSGGDGESGAPCHARGTGGRLPSSGAYSSYRLPRPRAVRGDPRHGPRSGGRNAIFLP